MKRENRQFSSLPGTSSRKPLNKKVILLLCLTAAVVLTILVCSIILVVKFMQFRNSAGTLDGTETEFSSVSEPTESLSEFMEQTSETYADEGTLQGYVLDLQSLPLENAEITLISASDGTETTVLTDQDGSYLLQPAAGEYSLLAACEGYQEYRMDGIRIEKGAALQMEPILLKPDMNYEAQYYDYIRETLRPKYGLAGMNRFDTKSDGMFGSVSYVPSQVQGLVSADIADYTGDGVPDLLTAVFTENDENYIWKLQLYTCTDGEVTKAAGYDFSIDRHGFFIEKAIRIEAVGGYIAVSSAYCAYEGMSSDYVFLKAATLKPALTMHLYSHAGDILTVNGKETYENIDANIRKAVQNLGAAYSQNMNKAYIELNLTGARCLTEYLRNDEIITPNDRTNLREKLGVSYSTSFIDTEVPTTETTEEPREILDTLHYDVDNDGKKETIEVFEYQNEYGPWELHYLVQQENGTEEEYTIMTGGDSLIVDCIVYDHNIGRIYVAYLLTGGGVVYPSFRIEGENYAVSAEAMLDYSGTDGYAPRGAEYSINGWSVSMEKARAYFENLEILYSYRDPDNSILKSGLEHFFVDLASPTDPAASESAALPETTLPPETTAEDTTEPETTVTVPME